MVVPLVVPKQITLFYVPFLEYIINNCLLSLAILSIAVHTEYRYLVCENYCIFYLESDDQVIVVRILYQRQDSLRALFLKK